MKRGFFYFIVFDLVVASLLILNLSFKNKNEGQSLLSPIAVFWAKINVRAVNIDSSQNLAQNTITPLSNIYHGNNSNNINMTSIGESKNHLPICITYGPLNLEDKSSLDVILNQSHANLTNIQMSKLPLYEIYWNLGHDKVQAINMFEGQKNDGALQDEKFKITQDVNGDWIVPISVVAGNLELAKKMSIDLRTSSKKIGGRWQYRSKSEGYFYQFKDIGLLSNNTLTLINRSIDTLKTPCSS